MAIANRSKPGGTIVPHLIYDDVDEAIKWLCATFGFTERLRIGDEKGRVGHAQLDIGDGGGILLGESRSAGGVEYRPPGTAGVVSTTLLVHVDDVDQHYEHVKQRGARILQPPATHPYGERQYNAEDLAGYRWTFSQTVADVDPSEWGATAAKR
jgi:uncharacterized glyoxalase superfamily protein PhnB